MAMLRIDPMSMMSGEPDKPLPRPKERTPQAMQEYHNALYKKYGGYSKERADWGDYLDWGLKSKPDVTIGKATKDIAKKYGLRPEVLYSSAMEEGMRKLFPRHGKPDGEGSGDANFPIAGYETFGLDTFGDRYPDLVKRGYLDKEFQGRFSPRKVVNELGEPQTSANFKDVDDAIAAKAAIMKMSRDDIDKYITDKKIPLSDKAKDFFALAAYNMGPEKAAKMLDSYNQGGHLKDDAFLKKRPTEFWQQPYENVMRRMQMSEILKKEGYFPDDPPESNQTMLRLSK